MDQENSFPFKPDDDAKSETNIDETDSHSQTVIRQSNSVILDCNNESIHEIKSELDGEDPSQSSDKDNNSDTILPEAGTTTNATSVTPKAEEEPEKVHTNELSEHTPNSLEKASTPEPLYLVAKGTHEQQQTVSSGVQPVVQINTTIDEGVISKRPEPTAAIEKKKEDEKLTIYKALAIKLKKELVKSRDEHQKLKDESELEIRTLRERVDSLEKTLDSERQSSATTIVSLEVKVKNLKQELETSESELQALQSNFESYKVRASKIMQQTNQMQSNSNKTFEEERYKQLKGLNENQAKRISGLELQLSTSLDRSKDLEIEVKSLQNQLETLQTETKSIKILDSKCETLSRENENLRLALKEYRTKLKEPSVLKHNLSINCDQTRTSDVGDIRLKEDYDSSTATNRLYDKTAISGHDKLDDIPSRVSPSASMKDELQTTSSSSNDDGSTSGYVHIKPAPTFEIISRSSVLEDAQNQIDNLTKAYLDSENTNSLLSDQVRALKEEIRRMQRGTERMDLAENLEYLKNVVFKFLSLDNGQIEQKQRLVPVLSTVLKLSPDETAQLTSLTCIDKPSMASSFFKL